MSERREFLLNAVFLEGDPKRLDQGRVIPGLLLYAATTARVQSRLPVNSRRFFGNRSTMRPAFRTGWVRSSRRVF
jgi:hypothetical protein